MATGAARLNRTLIVALDGGNRLVAQCCPFARLGWEAMRQALTDPDSVPADPPN